jgi:hypothetical protein
LRHQKLDVGTVLVGLGALGLIVSLFLDWYSPSLSAFDVFEFLDWTLAACAVAALVGVALALTDGAPRWLPAVGVLPFFVAASQVIDPPPAAHQATREVGAWLGLGCALAMAAGVALAAASIAITVDVRGRERRRRVAAVDRRDAAEADAPEPPPSRAGLFTDRSGQASAAARGAEASAPEPGDPERTQPLSALDREGEEAPGA